MLRRDAITLLVLAASLSCRSTPAEPLSAADASPPPPPPAPSTRVILEADHLHSVRLAVGDLLEAPHDEAFDWQLKTEGDALRVAPSSESGRSRLQASHAGDTTAVATGEPKCRREDAHCGVSKREWTVFVRVR